MQFTGDTAAPGGWDDVQALQPRWLDPDHPDRTAVGLREQEAAREGPPPLQHRLERVLVRSRGKMCDNPATEASRWISASSTASAAVTSRTVVGRTRGLYPPRLSGLDAERQRQEADRDTGRDARDDDRHPADHPLESSGHSWIRLGAAEQALGELQRVSPAAEVLVRPCPPGPRCRPRRSAPSPRRRRPLAPRPSHGAAARAPRPGPRRQPRRIPR